MSRILTDDVSLAQLFTSIMHQLIKAKCQQLSSGIMVQLSRMAHQNYMYIKTTANCTLNLHMAICLSLYANASQLFNAVMTRTK